ncbi:hypothetical protein EDD86DRAFT_193901 [Gorgonomyces haynaldii]|nr:hypothetical protein EDD86DRAFT_193901 [Gorgonomyces haynaldii]
MRLFSTTRQLSRYNRIVLVGNIGADPTYKEISSANDNVYKKWRFSLATNRSKKIGGQWERLTDWHNVETFRTVEHLGVGFGGLL